MSLTFDCGGCWECIFKDDHRDMAQVSHCWNRRVRLSRCDIWANNPWPQPFIGWGCRKVKAPQQTALNVQKKGECFTKHLTKTGVWNFIDDAPDLEQFSFTACLHCFSEHALNVGFFSPLNFARQSRFTALRRQLFVKFSAIIPWPTFGLLQKNLHEFRWMALSQSALRNKFPSSNVNVNCELCTFFVKNDSYTITWFAWWAIKAKSRFNSI